MQKHFGFTLVELIITLSVAAVLVSLAVPGLRAMIQNNRALADITALQADINLARSEAIKRGSRVSICRTNAPNAANPCGQGTSWADGWIVFDDEDGTVGQPDNAADILKLRTQIDLEAGSTFIGNQTLFAYLPSGRLNGASGTVRRCDDRGFTSGRKVVVATSGRVRSLAHDADLIPPACDTDNNVCQCGP